MVILDLHYIFSRRI